MTLSALRFEPRPEGVNHVDHALVDAVFLDVQRIHVAANVSVFRATGELLLDRFFGGDVEAFARIGRKHASLAALMRDERLPRHGAHLWYALSLLPHLRAIGEELANTLPMAHHCVLLHVDDLDPRRALAKRATTMSRDELQIAVTRWRDSKLTRRQLDIRRARRRATEEKRLARESAVRESAVSEPWTTPDAEATTNLMSERGPSSVEAIVSALIHAATLAGVAPVTRAALAALSADNLAELVSDLHRVANRVDDLLDVFMEESERRGTA